MIVRRHEHGAIGTVDMARNTFVRRGREVIPRGEVYEDFIELACFGREEDVLPRAVDAAHALQEAA